MVARVFQVFPKATSWMQRECIRRQAKYIVLKVLIIKFGVA
jgi:hypothetical protein